jgi:serine/threonine protein kinase
VFRVWFPENAQDDKYSGCTEYIVGQELSSGDQSVVFRVSQTVPAWVKHLRAGGEDEFVAAMLACVRAGTPDITRHHVLEVAPPWELSDSYQLDYSLEGLLAYIASVENRVQQEQHLMEQFRTADAGAVNGHGEHIVKCLWQGRTVLPGCQYALPALVLEHCECTLQEKGAVDATTAARYLSQVAQGLMGMHKQGWAHTNLQASHCLVDASGNIKLCGFSCAEEFARGLPRNYTLALAHVATCQRRWRQGGSTTSGLTCLPLGRCCCG